MNGGRKNFSQASDEIANGTITFVESGGKTYGITCWHIISIYRNANEEHGQYSHTMRTMVNGFYIIVDRFIRPAPEFGHPQLDIAIREINPELLNSIGKVPIKLDIQPEVPTELHHAIAVGFPTELKYKKHENDAFHRVSMPHALICAEL